MAYSWVHNFFIPIIKTVVVGGIVGYILFVIGRGTRRQWRKQTKWFVKYKLGRRAYPEFVVKWCLDAINNGIGYYDAKKMLLLKGYSDLQISETMFIYDKMLLELQKGDKTIFRREKPYSPLDLPLNEVKGGK